MNDTIDALYNQEISKELCVEYLAAFGIQLQDIRVSVQENAILLIGSEIVRKVSRDVTLVYENIEIELKEGSLGIRKLFALIGPLLDVLQNGHTLIYDEIETSLHPMIARNIISLFMNPAANPKGAQIIFTTHDRNLLDLTLMRKDQIYFVEKNYLSFASDVYSLADLKDVRKDENIELGYMRGRYGAIPYLQGETRIKTSFKMVGDHSEHA